VLALILSLPMLFGLWTWITVDWPPPRYVYEFLAAGRADVGRLDRGGFSGEEDDTQSP
jgi:hypothetical protein